MLGIKLVEGGHMPDLLIRAGIRRLLRQRLREIGAGHTDCAEVAQRNFRIERRLSPIAPLPERANDQHYEVLPDFFQKVLGPRLKYSCGLWTDGVRDLADSEEEMLGLTAERAELTDGLRILDLGCGWGSLSIWMATRYPNAEIVSVSNSKPQRDFILAQCRKLDLRNVEVITADVNDFVPPGRFDRILSVEMFEHVRNHEALLSRISAWLQHDGKLFVHHFSHRNRSYPFEIEGSDDWMGRYFFSGGMMPSDDLLLHCQKDLIVEDKWQVNGTHYKKTCDAWLALQDAHRDELLPVLETVYGRDQAKLWHQRWRLFFLSCSELFGFSQGNEWWVTHTLMSLRGENG